MTSICIAKPSLATMPFLSVCRIKKRTSRIQSDVIVENVEVPPQRYESTLAQIQAGNQGPAINQYANNANVPPNVQAVINGDANVPSGTALLQSLVQSQAPPLTVLWIMQPQPGGR